MTDDISIDLVKVGDRMRSLNPEAVESLAKSLRETGLINPIVVQSSNYRLIAGAHRLAAARRLGWTHIDCAFRDLSDDEALIIEIDENLSRLDLSPAERAIHIARRKEVYERLHPETKHGGSPGKAGGGKVPRLPLVRGFVDETAAASNKGRSTIAREVTRARHIPQLAETVGTSLDEATELDALAKLSASRQAVLIQQAKSGQRVSAKPEAKRQRREERVEAMRERTENAAGSLGAKLYNVLYADPPWRFAAYSEVTGLDRAADNHYQTMTIESIRALVPPAAADAVLFLWATVPMLPEALSVMDAWGFIYKSHMVWVKEAIGTGYWFRNKHELLLVGVRGVLPAPAPGSQYASVHIAKAGAHSQKPAIFREMIGEMFRNLPCLELFARERFEGWDAWGNEV